MDAPSLLLGALAGAAFVTLVEWRGGRRTHQIYGVGLVIAALVFVVFAFVGSADDWTGTEMGGLFVFAAIAVGGIRRYPLLLALGWLLHVGWDAFLHSGPDVGFLPAWYVPACIGFDLVVAGAILVGALPFRAEEAQRS